MFKGLSGATTWSDRQKNHCTVTSDQGLSFDIWLINVTSLMTSQQDCNLLSFLMSFSLFQPTQHPPTTIILVSKWSQESCGSFDTLIKKYVDFRPKNYRSRQYLSLHKYAHLKAIHFLYDFVCTLGVPTWDILSRMYDSAWWLVILYKVDLICLERN